jgi:hypothetical protein
MLGGVIFYISMIQMLGLAEFGKEIHPQTRNTDGGDTARGHCKDSAKGGKPVFFFEVSLLGLMLLIIRVGKLKG